MLEIPDIIFRVDRELRYTYINTAAEQATGIPPHAFIGKTNHELGFPKHVADFFDERLQEVLDTGKDVVDEFEMAMPSGESHYFQTRAIAEEVKAGKVISVLGITRDITQLKMTTIQLQQQKDFNELIISNCQDGILAFDRQCRYTAWNQAMQRITGVSAETALGRIAFDVFPFLVEIDEDSYFYTALRGESCISKDRIYHIPETGREGYFDASYSPIFDKEKHVIGGLAIIRDVTERKSYSDQMLKANEDLEDIVLKRTRELAASEERFRTLFEQSPLSMQLFAVDGTCLRANQAWERLWQSKQEQLQGYNILKDSLLASKNILPEIKKAFQGEIVNIPAVRYDPAEIEKIGRVRWVEASVYPLKDIYNKVREVALVLNDVTERIQAEEVLRKNEEHFRSLAEAIPHIVWTTDANGESVYYNSRWYDYTGLSAGESWESIVHPDDIAKIHKAWQDALATREVFNLEYRIKNKDNQRYYWHHGKGLALKDEKGEVIKWFGTATDIDEQKQAELALKQAVQTSQELLEIVRTINRLGKTLAAELDLEKLVQAVTDAATTVCKAKFGAFFYNAVDRQGKLYTLYTLSGAPREKFANFPLPRHINIFNDTFTNKKLLRCDDITQDPRYGKDSFFYGTSEDYMPIKSYLAVPVVGRSGEVIGGLFLGHDQTHIFTEREEQLAKGLAGQVAIAMDNARLYQKAQDAVRARDEFFSIASHELKTPLTPLKLHLQSLLRAVKKATLEAMPAEQLKQILSTCLKQVGRLTAIVDDLLDVSRINADQLHLNCQEVNLYELIKEVVEDYATPLARAKCSIDMHVPQEIIGYWDKLRLEQVIVNLLTNAMKYAPERLISITASRKADLATIIVRDHGAGIAKEDLARIFYRFERVSARDRHISGLGLGLFITRKIVEAHGGSIQVDSQLGEGSSFIIELPLRN